MLSLQRRECRGGDHMFARKSVATRTARARAVPTYRRYAALNARGRTCRSNQVRTGISFQFPSMKWNEQLQTYSFVCVVAEGTFVRHTGERRRFPHLF